MRKPDGEGHAVLTVRTDKGDFILDNLTDAVRQWDETGYRFLKRQASDHTGHWVTIREGQAPLVGSVEYESRRRLPDVRRSRYPPGRASSQVPQSCLPQRFAALLAGVIRTADFALLHDALGLRERLTPPAPAALRRAMR